jgi:Tfp pilus assembly protein PilF
LQSSAAANPAVVSLLNTANAQSRAGDHARAAATLERAIAIEPDNAWLWHRLAGARLAEGRLSQAASLAAKSNSLANSPATTDRSLQADNWKLIAEVRRRQGDTGAAAAAESQAARLSN